MLRLPERYERRERRLGTPRSIRGSRASIIVGRLLPIFLDGRLGALPLGGFTMRVQGKQSDGSSRLRHGAHRVRLILIESGSAGLGAHTADDGSEQTCAIVQADGESAAEFAQRAIRRIRTLEQSRRIVDRAFLLLGPRAEGEVMVARLLIARALIKHAATAPAQDSELVLNASSSTLQRGLSELVDALMEEPRTGAVTIGVQICWQAPTG
jgi:hypothetical protein